MSGFNFLCTIVALLIAAPFIVYGALMLIVMAMALLQMVF
jgi:hypothetical protein